MTGIKLTAVQRRTLRMARESLGLSQTKAAARAGVSQAMTSLVESGSRNVSLETLDAMCRAVGLRARLVLEKRGR